MAVDRASETPVAEEIRYIWRLALAVFVITIAIGLVNGQRIGQINPQAERPILLTHLHTGTIGWITLGLFGAAIWLFTAGRAADGSAGGVRALARYGALGVAVYPITFFLFYPGGVMSSGALLGLFGTLALIAIAWLLAWTYQQSRHVYMSVARLALLGAIFNLTLGAILGVLVELRFAGLDFPGNVNQAHPAMMTIGYVLPAMFGLVEWRLGGGIDGPRSRWGTISIALLVIGGVLAALAALANLVALFPIVLLFQIAAAIIFVVRFARRIVGAPWLTVGPDRFVAVTAIAAVIDVAILVYAVNVYFVPGLEPPRTLFVGLAHTEFVGGLTNGLFALLLLATTARRDEVWPWADDAIFWGVNVGWAGFALVEWMGALDLVRVFTPIMGVGLLVGIATFWVRLGMPARTPAATYQPAP